VINASAHRTLCEPERIADAVRGAFARVDAAVALSGVEPITDAVPRSVAEPRLTTAVVAGFAAAALVLGAVGVYGMLSFDVGRRRRELEVRLALGARPSTIVTHVVARGLAPVVIGLGGGLLGALVLRRLLTTRLFVVSLLATALPAYRASRVDPSVTLR